MAQWAFSGELVQTTSPLPDLTVSRNSGHCALFDRSGNLLILKAGTVLTETWIERLGNFARVHAAEQARVRVPKVVGTVGPPRLFHGASGIEADKK